MPSKYERKCPNRGKWTEEALQAALQSIAEGMNVNEAARVFEISPRTLKRRVASGNSRKGRMGPDSLLGEDADKKMVIHINKLQARGAPTRLEVRHKPPTRLEVRRMAFHLAEQLKIQHKSDRQAELAGYDWLSSFLRRHPELSTRTAESLSRNYRSLGMDREVVAKYFELLSSVLEQYQLLGKSACLYNMDETGLEEPSRRSDW
ncbi:CENP-B N-terminal DNA-binding domain [Popillia japonica]|uniref:CENP-B N-terminal DNA-binding domain n=1 Tax=Popillia japonica TaxID=7064 RepID=A0AAW1N5A3_POPJA